MKENYGKMNKAQLEEKVVALGLNLPEKRTKATLIALILDKKSADERGVELGSVQDKLDPCHRAGDYAVNAMKNAIAVMHSYPLCNKRAINADDAMMAGVSEERFHQWCSWVDDLREVACVYVTVKHDKSKSDKEREVARARVYSTWRSILKVGEEDVFHPNMFITPYDVDSLVGYAETFMATARGTQIVCTSKTIFRKQVESLLGCRMAANAVMTDKDREDLQTYYSAMSSKKSAEKRLHGSTNNAEEHVPGILDKIRALNEKRLDTVKLLEDHNADETIKTSFLASIDAQIKEQIAAKESAEKSLNNAEETIARLKERCELLEDNMLQIKLD